jgi:hypothetical protein
VAVKNRFLGLLFFIFLITFYYSQSMGFDDTKILSFNDKTPFAITPYCEVIGNDCFQLIQLRGDMPILELEKDFDGNLSRGTGVKINLSGGWEISILKANKSYPFLILTSFLREYISWDSQPNMVNFRNTQIDFYSLIPSFIILFFIISILAYTYCALRGINKKRIFVLSVFSYYLSQFLLGIFNRGSDLKYVYRSLLRNEDSRIFEGVIKSLFFPTQTFSAVGLEPRNITALIFCCSMILFFSTRHAKYLYLIPLGGFFSITQMILLVMGVMLGLFFQMIFLKDFRSYLRLFLNLLLISLLWVISVTSVIDDVGIEDYSFWILNSIAIIFTVTLNLLMFKSYAESELPSKVNWFFGLSFFVIITILIPIEYLSRSNLIFTPEDGSSFMWIRALMLEGQGRIITSLSFISFYAVLYLSSRVLLRLRVLR